MRMVASSRDTEATPAPAVEISLVVWKRGKEAEASGKKRMTKRKERGTIQKRRTIIGKIIMKIKKAVIPVAGKGTRFLPITKQIPKEMIPILDRPIIQYVVEEAIQAGVEQINFYHLLWEGGPRKLF